MTKNIIVSFVGKDLHTFVDVVLSELFDQLGSVEKCWMIDVGGWFFAASRFHCSSEQLEKVQTLVHDLKNQGTEIYLRMAEREPVGWRKRGLRVKLEVIGLEHPNVIKKVITILESHHVRTESLKTQVSKTAFSFEMPILDLTLEGVADKQTDVTKAKEDLAKLAQEMRLVLIFD